LRDAGGDGGIGVGNAGIFGRGFGHDADVTLIL
jgi:hypothetical protein